MAKDSKLESFEIVCGKLNGKYCKTSLKKASYEAVGVDEWFAVEGPLYTIF